MTEQQHPITPPPELVQQWRNAAPPLGLKREQWIATQAARWGADQELEACMEWTRSHFHGMPQWADELRAARRPKSPSLAEQALDVAKEMSDCMSHGFVPKRSNLDIIRRALERLQELENNG